MAPGNWPKATDPAAGAPAANGNPPASPARGLSLRGALALNLIDMIGVGPFITLPLIVAAMGGPQAMLGWLLGAALALCDGLVWAELGAALPGEGGTYHYLSEIFGRERWGKLLSFLFVWQLLFSAPLTIASGCIGLALYAAYWWPALQGGFGIGLAAAACCLLALWLAYQRIGWINRVSQWLWAGVAVTVGWVIFAGATHFHAARAFDFPPHAFALSAGFFLGLGSAMGIATYDYWGYENANYLAGEVVRPERTLPRAVLGSIGIVAALYLAMNVTVLGVVPWRTLLAGAAGDAQAHVISTMMLRIYGPGAARVATLLIVWTAFASVFSLMLGYSRVLYAAAAGGNFFRGFARLHPKHRFPSRALLALGLVAAAFCFLRLDEVIAALVAIRVLLQYLLQAIGLIVLRKRQPDLKRPFRMPLYPLPALAAIAGFLFLLLGPAGAARQLAWGGAVLAAGVAVFAARARRTRTWPAASR
jgi:APA family basic amino acid/polyamine antiporter